ncbi:MAG: EamA family transporter [Candidatus Moranbacteria bacterium]|jgi:multidrug transporter EmrE-like cation transporter|nr:EamA family transporter [Candidatus Moranbacteria bacterium]MBP9801376.1 EamA family transporter [Candidatus Moranbacteria bacterium]
MVLFLTITAGIILTIGDIVLKQWVRNSSSLFYAGGIFLYLISMNLLAYSYKYENIAVASLLMVIFNILTLTFVGYFFFHENITPYEIIGIVLGIASVSFLEIGK